MSCVVLQMTKNNKSYKVILELGPIVIQGVTEEPKMRVYTDADVELEQEILQEQGPELSKEGKFPSQWERSAKDCIGANKPFTFPDNIQRSEEWGHGKDLLHKYRINFFAWLRRKFDLDETEVEGTHGRTIQFAPKQKGNTLRRLG